MNNLEITDLLIYPIKSSIGFKINEANVLKTGFEYDRLFAIINSKNKVLTARENSKILKIHSDIIDNKLTVYSKGFESIETELKHFKTDNVSIEIFGDSVKAKSTNEKLNNWITIILGEKCELITIDNDNLREIKSKYNGKKNEKILFSDIAPIHLISRESLDLLNSKLETSVSIENFRPNVVVTGCKPFEEDNWKSISIGNCEFDVMLKTPRCSLTTINPKTTEINKNQEPLRTLSIFRKENNNINFGIYLVPRTEERININDKIKTTGNNGCS